jgi:pre-mRNA-processing factor SLU7
MILTVVRHGEAGYDRYGMDSQEWYARGLRAGPAATKYRKGACTNCGAMTHLAKDCLDRPRKIGAKFSGKDIQADEIIRHFDQSFEGKRDLWNGYDPQSFRKNMEEWEKVEEVRRVLKEEKKAEGKEEDSDDDDKYEFEPDALGGGYDEKTRTSVRNLRLREDTAKYLLTNKSSSHYDPKSRSMRDLPDPSQVTDPKLSNGTMEFSRPTGDAADFQKLEKFAWQSERIGGDIHLQANPTQAEVRHRQLQAAAEEGRSALRSSVLEKYGGEEHLVVPPRELLKATTQFVEYSKTGEVLRGVEPATKKSRYREDVFPGNHSSVWGSFFRGGKWGFACCRQFMKQSYCTGQDGIDADDAAERLARGVLDDLPPPSKRTEENGESGSKESVVKRKRLDDGASSVAAKKKNFVGGDGMTEEEYEEYRRKKITHDDPLLQMQSLEGGV